MEIELPQALVDDVAKGRVTLFLGAGASREANFPDSGVIAEFLAEKAGGKLGEVLKGQPLDLVADFLYPEPGYGQQWVRQKIIELFDQFHKSVKHPPSSAHELITRIRWSTIFTTNYDRLVEISYYSNTACVQRFLPIYSPNPQVLRREEDTVRLIKLNGSVDEAERNNSHNLVITFADQQNSLSYNALFYDLLKEEAINGPIIFVGFSFTHPGARAQVSSPEYRLLESLMREMGPAARWHYYVAPFDEADPQTQLLLKRLKSNNIMPINSTFGQFMNVLYKQLTSPPIPLEKRPPIVIKVGNNSITLQADDYSKDKRHFELVGRHLDTYPAPPVARSLNGFENWSSFYNKHFIERAVKQDFVRRLRKLFDDSGKSSILAFVASAGWGKTFFLRDIAVQFSEEGHPIIWLNPFSTIDIKGETKTDIVVGTWDTRRIDAVVGMVNSKSKETNIPERESIPIIMADNCSERAEETLSLYRTLSNNGRLFILLIAFRTDDFKLLTQQNPMLKSCGIFKPEGKYNSTDEVRTLVDFCARNQVALISDESQKEVITQRIIESEADIALIFALQIIFDKQHRPFAEIVRGIWESLGSDDLRQLVLRVASLHRFGSTFYPRFYSLLNTFPPHSQIRILAAYKICVDRGILFEETENDEPCVRTLHSLVAEKIAQVSGATLANLDDEMLLLSKNMSSNNLRDLELIRRMLKAINDYTISLSSEEKIEKLFQEAVRSTNQDWVVCQQFSKYLLRRNEYEKAFAWASVASEQNPGNGSLQHQKGNILGKWGMALIREEQKVTEANLKFEEARKYFTLSRMGSMPSEHGFVTHLDMLLYLINRSKNDLEKANLIAEGAQLFVEGVRAVPQDAYNMILDPRFHIFDLEGNAINELCEKIEKALEHGRSTVYGVAFVADNLYEKGDYIGAINLLHEQRKRTEEGVLLWVKEAELHAKEGYFSEASKCLDSARMREKSAENAEVLYRMAYWDLITSFIIEDFKEARIAAGRLARTALLGRQRLPQGYVWKDEARHIDPSKRQFRQHARIWSGRVESIQVGGDYGRIELKNAVGETFNVEFIPKYFERRNFRPYEYLEFVIAIYPFGLRAISVDSRMFANTTDDVFVKE
jgi:tetratricopeptide (TPR) repeat protein